MVQRFHHMPFGATVGDNGVRFRLWAPAAHRVDLKLPETGRVLAMPQIRHGWFDFHVPEIGDGCLYQFVIDGETAVADPASRFQPLDVHGPSAVVDPRSFEWDDAAWIGRPWHEAVIYEIHIGTFTADGSFAAATGELDRLARLGVTAIELMPLADFGGARNWGYDGVLPFAPDSRYGRPNELKALIAEAHRLGLMTFIDVVYNHFGPEGNYLSLYAPQFFSELDTAWGRSLNFARIEGNSVRDYFIENALYWLIEYHADGLRLDAVHAILDQSESHFLEELASRVRERIPSPRQIHLVLENDNNQARFLERDEKGAPRFYDAQWNDDFHHALHVILAGETDGYYADYAAAPLEILGRSLTQGFAYQGDWSAHRQRYRGEPSAHLPPTAFVSFLQNHDQVGNRAFGERLSTLVPAGKLAAATAILLLAPSPPLLFMGEEWGAREPFLFFCDFKGDLGAAVREGRRQEFARFPAFADETARETIPDPVNLRTFQLSLLDRSPDAADPEIVEFHRVLLDIRRREIVPRLVGIAGGRAGYEIRGGVFGAWWRLGDDSHLRLAANLSETPSAAKVLPLDYRVIYRSANVPDGTLPPWSIVWAIRPGA